MSGGAFPKFTVQEFRKALLRFDVLDKVMTAELNIDRPVTREKIEVQLLVYGVEEQEKTENGYRMMAKHRKREDEIIVTDKEPLSDFCWIENARTWAIAKKEEDGTYKVTDDSDTEIAKNPFDYVIVKKGKYAPEKTYEVEVDVHTARHLVADEKSLEVIDFWNAASQARKLVHWEPEKEKIPDRFDEGRMGEKLFPYVKLGDVALRAVRMAAEEIYNFTFDRRGFRVKLKENEETAPLANMQDVIDIAKLACIYLYEELCFEDGVFAGLEKARDRLEAFPGRVMNYSKLKGGPGNIVMDAESMFLETHPAVAELCEKCFIDRRKALVSARKDQARKHVEFFDSLPDSLKKIVKELRPIYEKMGNYYRYLTGNVIRYEYHGYNGKRMVRYITVPVPSPKELEGLKIKEKELKTRARMLLEEHGIKGTVPPLVEPEKFIDPLEETLKKKKWIERQRKRFCKD